MAKWCDVLPMIADDRRNVVLQQEGRLPAMACAYVLDNGVSLSTPSHGLSWAAGMTS